MLSYRYMEQKINTPQAAVEFYLNNLPQMSKKQVEGVIPDLLARFPSAASGFSTNTSALKGSLLEKTNVSDFLKWIVSYSRDVAYKVTRNNIFVGGCKNSSQEVQEGLNIGKQMFKIKSKKINTKDVFGKAFPHTLDIAEIDSKKYIVDPTFIQFFAKVYECDGVNAFIPNANFSVFDYFTATKERKDFAQNLSSYGFIEVTDDNIKNYFDCWAMLNDKVKDCSEKTSTTGKTYWQAMINGNPLENQKQ